MSYLLGNVIKYNWFVHTVHRATCKIMSKANLGITFPEEARQVNLLSISHLAELQGTPDIRGMSTYTLSLILDI
jgi:hypothetical protein